MEAAQDDDGEWRRHRLTRRWEEDNSFETWRIQVRNVAGSYNQALPLAALPQGLRFLQFNHNYNRPLQAGLSSAE